MLNTIDDQVEKNVLAGLPADQELGAYDDFSNGQGPDALEDANDCEDVFLVENNASSPLQDVSVLTVNDSSNASHVGQDLYEDDDTDSEPDEDEEVQVLYKYSDGTTQYIPESIADKLSEEALARPASQEESEPPASDLTDVSAPITQATEVSSDACHKPKLLSEYFDAFMAPETALGVCPSPQPLSPNIQPPSLNVVDVPQGEARPILIDDCVFMFEHDGLYGKQGAKSAMRKLSSPFAITNLIVDEDGIPFGVLLDIFRPGSRTIAVKIADLVISRKEAIRLLVQSGLWVSPSMKAHKLLARFIAHVSESLKCIRGTFRTGFHVVGGSPYFVLPGKTFPQTPENPVFINEGGSLGAGHYEATCDLRTWQEKIGFFCQGNHILTFAACIPLVSLWLLHFNMQGAGVHFWGRSSTGKSTAAFVAASIMLGKFENIFRNWNATANGLEAVCEINDEGCFCLDEIGECAPKDVYKAIYMISNGRPKKRFTDKDVEQKQWRLMYISTGELSSKAHLELGGIKQKTGQALRLLDIPVEVENGYGAFHHFHPNYFSSPAELSQHLRREAEKCRGAVMEAYLDVMLRNFPSARQFVEDQMVNFTLAIPPEDDGQVQRAHQLFALCAAAGEFGIQQGILPWAPGQAIGAAKYVYEVWLASFRENSVPEAEKIMDRLNSVLMRHGESSFAKYQNSNGPGSLGNAFGYRQDFSDGSSHLILPADGFEMLFEGFESRTVCAVLKQKGMLLTDGRNNTVKRTLPGNHITRCYVIKIAQ